MVNLQMPQINFRRMFALRKIWNVLVVLALCSGAVFVAHGVMCVGRYGEVEPGRLYRSRQPKSLQYSVLFHRHNISRVINLRLASENPEAFAREKSVCKRSGIEFFNIPIGSAVPSKLQAERFLFLVDTSPGPVLVHCQMGRNRTGIMCSLWRLARQGIPVAQALREEMTAYNATPTGDKRRKIIDLLEYYKSKRGVRN
jgi:protein tyrosine/serine phosphatase